ncbi:MAG TPA: UDP-3-O-(3-hydroxymyristoyl)glucosamine N-acyltransferase [Xanthobacteraceae bacterium]|jgi:UDP-3-O-[3-hydroxymyristoyl] glucosamine N-acyltransferase|nr:UDP-3-O-(3-hydroxymyristoyl)glucosamine N-acyltransferase [Xanthobacteraceae bacterium]
MSEPIFFKRQKHLTVGEIAALTQAEPRPGTPLDRAVVNVASLETAGPTDLAFLDNSQYADHLASTRAGACLISPRFAERASPDVAVLVAAEPYRAFVTIARELFPDSLRPLASSESGAVSPKALVDPSSRLENGVTVEPGAVIGPRVEIGAGTHIGATAVIASDVRIGRDCSIGAAVTIAHTLIGDQVIIHPGCRIGQDGFGYVMGARGHLKVPQIGRVIIQDRVEIGAGSTVDRGAIRDTVIGEGTKIDNLVQVGHNVVIGRHCVIVAQTGISGSVTLEDFVVLGARAGVNNHLTIGEGAQIAGTSIVHGDVPPGARWGGMPAKPVKQWFREIMTLERLARPSDPDGKRQSDR